MNQQTARSFSVGVVPELNPAAGGAYQYALTVLDALVQLQHPEEVGVAFHLLLGDKEPQGEIAERLRAWPRSSLYPPLPFHKRLAQRVLGNRGRSFIRRTLAAQTHSVKSTSGTAAAIDVDRPPLDRPAQRQWLQSLGLDWLFYLMPHTQTVEIGLPFVMPIHDLQHRLQPEFPETSADGQWEEREHFYRHVARKALVVLADSETGKEDILNCYADYGITPERIHVVPFLPAAYTREKPAPEARERLLAPLALPERFLFYPAQFWSHKNHQGIVEALALLRESGTDAVHVVFCGSHSNAMREQTFSQLQRRIAELNLERQIHYLSYVSNETLTALFCQARALIMPTFFGPTNIPPLEAWSLDCPVITSDIRGIREQMGDAALLVDPRSRESIAEGIRRVWEDDGLCETLIVRGRARLAAYPPAEFEARITRVIHAANALYAG